MDWQGSDVMVLEPGPASGPEAERWRAVPGHPDYEVSDQGRVRSYLDPKGRGRRIEIPRPMRLTPMRGGTLMIQLRGGGWRNTYSVASLVLGAFVGPRPDGWCPAYRDGDQANVKAANLWWGFRRILPTRIGEAEAAAMAADRDAGLGYREVGLNHGVDQHRARQAVMGHRRPTGGAS